MMKRLLFLLTVTLLLVGCQDEQSNESQDNDTEEPSEIVESNKGGSTEEGDRPNPYKSIYTSFKETQDIEPTKLRIGPVYLEDISVNMVELMVTEVSEAYIEDQSDYLHISAEITIDEDTIPSDLDTSSYFDNTDFKLETNTGDVIEASDFYSSRMEFYVITGFAADMPLDLYFPIDETTVDDITSGTVTIFPPKDPIGDLLAEEEVELTFKNL